MTMNTLAASRNRVREVLKMVPSVVMAGLAVISAGAQTRLSIASVSGRVVELTVSVPAYHVAVLQYADKPNAHPSEWYGFHTFPANVSDQTHTHGLPNVGRQVFVRAFSYPIGPAPQQQTPPAAAGQQKAGHER